MFIKDPRYDFNLCTINSYSNYQNFVSIVTKQFRAQANKKQFETVLSFIEHGKREGATLLTGGKPLDRKGYYIEPTIFTDVSVSRYSEKLSQLSNLHLHSID